MSIQVVNLATLIFLALIFNLAPSLTTFSIFLFFYFLVCVSAARNDFLSPLWLIVGFYSVFCFFGFLAFILVRDFNPVMGTMYANFGLMLLLPSLIMGQGRGVSSNSRNVVQCSPFSNSSLGVAFCVIVVLIGVCCSFALFFKIGGLPLFLGEGPAGRISSMTGNGHLIQPMRFAPLGAIGLLGFKGMRRTAAFFLVVSLMPLIGMGMRGVALQNFLLFFLLLLAREGKALEIKTAIKIFVFLLILLFGLGLLRNDQGVAVTLLAKAINTVAVAPYIFDRILTDVDTYYYGATFFYKFSSLLPGEAVEYTQWLTALLGLNFSGGVTPSLVGDFYLNFGKLYIAGGVVLGLLVGLLNRYYNQRSGDFFLSFFAMYIAMGIARSSTGGISNTLFQTVLGILFFVALFIILRLGKRCVSRQFLHGD